MEAKNQPTSYREGGWGWAVVLASFTTMFVFYGTLKSFGVLLTVMKDDFDTDLWVIGSIGSLHFGVQYVLAPAAAAVVRKVGCRLVVVLGGILHGLGLILASMAQSVAGLTATLVVMAGTGGAFVCETTKAEVAFYFQEKYALAYFLASTGSPIGMMLYGPTTQVLLDTYGWRGTMLLMGGFSLHLVVCGMLIRPHISGVKVYEKVVSMDTADDKDVTSEQKPSDHASFCHMFVSATGLGIFTNAEFNILNVSRMHFSIVYGGVIVYMVPNGLLLGLTTTEASFLTTAWGVGCIVGGTLSAFVIHIKLLPYHAIAGIGGIITIVGFSMCPFITTLVGQMIIIMLIGVGMECLYEVVGVMTRNLPFNDDRQFNILGWQSFMTGISSSLGGVIAGWLYEVTGSFQVTFFMFSGLMVVATLCFLLDLVRLHFISTIVKPL